MAAGKGAAVAGATGSVGRLVVRTLLTNPRVECVTALVRKEADTERAKELWGEGKVEQLAVDYPKLVKEAKVDATAGPETTKVKKALEGKCDAFLTGLGVYTNNANEDEMDLIECSYNSAIASVAKDAGATRGAYLSGAGVKQPTLEGRAFSAFGRAKGRAEESLATIFPEGHVSCRPGAIFERPGPPVYGFLDGTAMNMWPFSKLKDSRFGITASDIAKGMVQGALFDDQKGNVIWENVALKEAARRYEADLGSEPPCYY